MEARSTARSRIVALISVIALTITGLAAGLVVAPAASAAPGPIQPAGADVVTADALPTVQIDGVAWSQAIAGDTVYVGGRFANARPAGAAPGQNQTPRANLLAYNIKTGNLITSFAPTLNGQVRAVAVSPDGKRVYVAGDFTTVNGAARNRVAAFDTATGQLITSFAGGVDYHAYALAVTNDTVYVGGDFNNARGVPRAKLAAFRASDGAVLGWNPAADAKVNALVVTPDGTKVVAGGAFFTVNGVSAHGMTSLDAISGAVQPWKANTLIRNAGDRAAILALTTDGTSIFGNGFHFGGPDGNFEGVFSASPADGTINWLQDCHGDTYANYPAAGAVYAVSHAHYCGNVGGAPQTDPWTFQYAMAFSKNATGTVNHDPHGYKDYFGNPAPSIIQWFPTLSIGSITGQSQAAWTITGNKDYVVLGGEFPRVNGAGQQGLVRFAVKPIAPAKQAPVLVGNQWTPSLVALSASSVRVAFPANWDRDDRSLTYKVTRNGNTATPVFTTTADSAYWDRPALGFKDTGLTPGQTYSYRLYANDAAGNTTAGTTVSITMPANVAANPYGDRVIADGASAYWPLGEPSGSVAFDHAGFGDADLGTGTARGAAGAVSATTATTFDGTVNGSMSSRTAIPGPDTYTTSAWIKTTSTAGGKVIGFGNRQTGTSGNYDRHIYMDNAGRLIFGVHPGGVRTITSPKSYNDGQWHQVVSTLGPNGMVLYVDGLEVAKRTDVTYGQAYTGFWRVGGDNTNGWTSRPSSNFLAGDIDEVAIFPTVLTKHQVVDQYVASGRVSPVPNVAPVAQFTATNTDLTAAVDGTTSTDSDGSVVGHAWNFGDGGTAAGATATHAYAAAGTYQVTLTVTDNRGATHAATKPVTVTAPPPNQLPAAAFTVAASDLTLDVDGSTSADPDGTIASHAWNFGDGSTGAGATASHRYAAAGTYRVVLTVTDNKGGVGTLAQDVTVTAPPPNQAPAAAFTETVDGLTVSLNGSSSVDPDGTVASYAWNFGDGTTGEGEAVSRTYAAGGTYEVALTVTDDDGGTNTVRRSITVTAPPVPNQAPVAAYSSSAANLAATFDGSASADADGSIASHAWDFGDSTTGSGATTTHTYGAGGTYLVKLTVTDDDGATHVAQSQITVTPAAANQPPVAAFTSTAANLVANLDATTSSDPDGSIASYAWSFGDSTTGNGVTTSHTYGQAGTYVVTLTVTDDKGVATSTTKSVQVAAAANQTPVAAFTATTANLVANLDAGTSSDPDGSIASYAWDFGDGATGTGSTAQHTYAQAGSYTVTLTVTDDDGATASKANQVTVAAAQAQVYASDQFGRTVPAGLGTADQGGAWTLAGTTSNFSVGAGVGRIRMAGAGAGQSASLNAVSAAQVDTTVDVSLDKAATGGGTYVSVAARKVGNSDYRVKVRFLAGGTVSAALVKVVNGTETTLGTQTVAGLTYAAGDSLRVRFTVGGAATATLQAKVWKVGSAEPDPWLISRTDTTPALAGAGGIGLVTYLSGSSTNAPVDAAFDNLTVVEQPAG